MTEPTIPLPSPEPEPRRSAGYTPTPTTRRVSKATAATIIGFGVLVFGGSIATMANLHARDNATAAAMVTPTPTKAADVTRFDVTAEPDCGHVRMHYGVAPADAYFRIYRSVDSGEWIRQWAGPNPRVDRVGSGARVIYKIEAGGTETKSRVVIAQGCDKTTPTPTPRTATPTPSPTPTAATRPTPTPNPPARSTRPADRSRTIARTPTPTGTRTVQGATSTNADIETEIVNLTNTERTKRGLKPLQRSACLDGTAQSWSARMRLDNHLYHSPMQFGKTCDLDSWAENVAVGQSTPTEVVADWMNSPGHRANILNPKYRELGVGRAGTYTTQHFGA